MINETIAEVAEKLGHAQVLLNDFVGVGTMQPNAEGLRSCESADYARRLRDIAELIAEKHPGEPERAANALVRFTAMRVCMNSDGVVKSNDYDLARFVALNKRFLARLSAPAVIVNYPTVVVDVLGLLPDPDRC